MKKVERYKCDFCGKLTVKEETMKHHEQECIHNPNGRNCFMCVHSVEGGYVDNWYGGEDFLEEAAFCGLHLEPLKLLRQQGFDALTCKDFVRDDKMYWHKKAER